MAEYIKYSTYTLDIQRKLNQVRVIYHHNTDTWPHLAEDGLYGPQTEKAVKAFQTTYNITSIRGLNVETVQALDQKLREKWLQSTTDFVNVTETWTGFLSDSLDKDSKWMKKMFKIYGDTIARKISDREKKLWIFDIDKAKKFPSHLVKISEISGNISWGCQLLTIHEVLRDCLEKYRRGEMTAKDFWSTVSELFGVIGDGAEILEKFIMKQPHASRLYATFIKLGMGSKDGFFLKFAGRLGVAGHCIGAYMMGCTIAEVIGSIPIPFQNGVTVQDRIDDVIDFIWKYPVFLYPISPSMSIGLMSVKQTIDWNVNRISNLKPLTDAERAQYEKYLAENFPGV